MLDLPVKTPDLVAWQKMLHDILHPRGKVTVGIIGKYTDHQDAYKSVFEALHHGAIAAKVALEIRPFESARILENGHFEETIAGCDGYVIPGGFGERGWEGKILAARYCRTRGIPYLGLCLGMQVMLVEFARHVLGLQGAHSTEVAPDTEHPVVSLLSEQKGIKNLGGTMRLGSYPCKILPHTLAHTAYGKSLVFERHRHRYEFNNHYKQRFEEKGMLFSGILEHDSLCEIAEIPSHPWMLGVQFHPEFQSKPLAPHPLFKEFIAAVFLHAQQMHGAGVVPGSQPYEARGPLGHRIGQTFT
jgi:CTP synthase